MKKVSYTCRKDTADKRLRIKGRFIKKEDQKDIMQRIFADEKITESNTQRLNQDLQDLVNSPTVKEELLMPNVKKEEGSKKKSASAKKP